jgi:zinc transport system ATP-binding protein
VTDPDVSVPAVEMNCVSAGYSRGESVISNVTLTIDQREFFALIGPNGGGKTTMVRVMLGLISPTRGSCRIFGQPVSEARQWVAYVPQFATHRRGFPLTVERMVALGLLNALPHGVDAEQTKRSVRRVLEQVNLTAYGSRPIQELSGGQFQRALIARALIRRPRLLILDEPTASVDPGGEESLMGLFERLSTEMTVVLVSHDIHYVVQSVRRVACVNHSVVVHPAQGLSSDHAHQIYGYPAVAIHHHHGGSDV